MLDTDGDGCVMLATSAAGLGLSAAGRVCNARKAGQRSEPLSRSILARADADSAWLEVTRACKDSTVATSTSSAGRVLALNVCRALDTGRGRPTLPNVRSPCAFLGLNLPLSFRPSMTRRA